MRSNPPRPVQSLHSIFMPPMDVTIEKLIYGGDGLAHHEGSTVFVPFVLPAERVAVSPVEQKKKFVRARVDKLLAASPQRTTPPCPHFGVCGGCNYQHIPYEAQAQDVPLQRRFFQMPSFFSTTWKAYPPQRPSQLCPPISTAETVLFQFKVTGERTI